MNNIERNSGLFKTDLVEIVDSRLAYGKSLIDTELNTGVFDIFIKPIVNAFYDHWCKEARAGSLQQINTFLECGMIIIKDGNEDYNFNKVVDEHFFTYLMGDQIVKVCKKDHKNYQKLKEILKDTFISQIKELLVFLKVNNDGIETFKDLLRATFNTKEDAYNSLIQRLDFTDKSIKVVESDLSILNIPAGKKIIIKALRKGFEETKQEFLANLNIVFN